MFGPVAVLDGDGFATEAIGVQRVLQPTGFTLH
jgi:hypothetical protein